jgi:hypothetical protein
VSIHGTLMLFSASADPKRCARHINVFMAVFPSKQRFPQMFSADPKEFGTSSQGIRGYISVMGYFKVYLSFKCLFKMIATLP